MSQTDTPQTDTPAKNGKRTYLSQSDVPRHSLEEALRIPRALNDEYGRSPTRPLEVAAALGIQPNSSQFRTLAGAALAYGFTTGGPNADVIGLTELGMRIVAPTEEGDDLTAQREALLGPRVVREFLQKYDGAPVPSDNIARNVLEGMGVPRSATERTLDLIVSSADSLGLTQDIKGKTYVNLRGVQARPTVEGDDETPALDDGAVEEVGVPHTESLPEPPLNIDTDEPTKETPPSERRVFVSHGSNRKIVEQLKKLLEYGEFEPVVSVEREATAKPVPKKVFDEMRSCGAGVIHVAKERTIVDQEGNEHRLLNENVLIEIGGSMALWSDNFILLVEQGTTLPSNLQGLYEVRYEGTTLDADATMKLLHAFKQFKSQ